ncbi:hypothetical protein [uncultured Paraglaciecola sp.]|uniref:hypothetical protein n=1 Tax=uncultured Paraglaciecola sp. TaxID=1765024 RepID=UPI0026013947|nr:hypothetical protein [uncultured Paraglaciecola sp.]
MSYHKEQTPAPTGVLPTDNTQMESNQQGNNSLNEKVIPIYKTIENTSTNTFVSFADLAEMARNPTVGIKDNASALTPYKANAKTKATAQKSLFYSLVQDHDDDDQTKQEIKTTYDRRDLAYLAFTSSTHELPKHEVIGKRWKVVIPLEQPIDFERYAMIAQGLTELHKSDKAQSRLQQVFFAPNKVSETASYEYIDELESRPLINALDDNNPLIRDALRAFHDAQKKEVILTKAAKPKPKPRAANADNSIINLVCDSYDLRAVLESEGNRKIGLKYLSPHSSSGKAGIVILMGDDGKERCYSHHGEADPLSSLNNNGHALDVFDVICILGFNGDVGKCVAHYANELDPDGQKSRQKEHMEQKDKVSVDDFEVLAVEAKKDTNNVFTLPDYPQELLNLPYQLGELQVFILNRMTYPSVATAGFTALTTLTAFAQTNITIKSRDGLGLNEYYMILAPTGFGKEDLRKPAEILDRKSNEAALSNHLSGILINDSSVRFRHSAPASTQGIHQILEGNRSVFFLSDEFAEWLRLSHKDLTKQAALGYLMQAYSKALSVIEPGHAVTTKYEPVENPRLSILATSTAEAMFETMTREQADSGAYNRWNMFVGEQELPQKVYDGLVYEPEDELVSFITWVKSHPECEIKFSQAGFKEFMRLDQKLSEPIKRKDALLGGRLGEQSIKIAALLALSDKRFVMSASDIKTAFNIRVGLYRRAAALTAHEGNMDGLHSTGQALKQVRVIFEKSPMVYKSQLGTKSRKYSKLNLYEQKAVIDALISEGVASQCVQSKAVLVSHICKGGAL